MTLCGCNLIPLIEVPKLSHDDDDDDNEMEDGDNKDARRTRERKLSPFGYVLMVTERLWDKSKQHENSLSDSEDEGIGGRKHRQSHKGTPENGVGTKKRRSGSPRGNALASSSIPAPPAANGHTDHWAAPVAIGNPSLASGSLAPPSAADSSSTAPMDISSWASAVGNASSADEDVEMGTEIAETTQPPPRLGNGGGGGGGSAAWSETTGGAGAGDMLAGGA